MLRARVPHAINIVPVVPPHGAAVPALAERVRVPCFVASHRDDRLSVLRISLTKSALGITQVSRLSANTADDLHSAKPLLVH